METPNQLNNNIWAIVPVKILNEAKSRLATVLTNTQRRQLATLLLQHTLQILADAVAAQLLSGYFVITQDKDILPIVEKAGGLVLAEAVTSEEKDDKLNAALAHAATVCYQHKQATAVLILPTDLPNLTLNEIASIITASYLQNKAGAWLVSDQHRQGTNLFLLKPPNLLNFKFYFGNDSFNKHLAALKTLAITPQVLELPGVSFDLDRPEDFYKLDDNWLNILYS